jgi:hypothetical protein
MKQKTLMFVCIMFSGNVFSQYNDDYIAEKNNIAHKGDNLITISTDRNAQTNFMEFGKHLVSHGFTFKTKDLDFMQLVTDAKRPEKGLHYDYTMNITFSGDDIIIRVKQSGMSAGSAIAFSDANIIWDDWHYATSSGNIMNQTFNDFYPVLKSYDYPVTFSKQ